MNSQVDGRGREEEARGKEEGQKMRMAKAGKCANRHVCAPVTQPFRENDAINDNGVLRRETELDVHAGMYNYFLRRRSVMPPALPQQLAGSR